MNPSAQPTLPTYTAARVNMIENQLRPNKVRDERVLTAMESLPREIFVPSSMMGIAYRDEDLEIAKGRYLLEPMVLARLLEEAHVHSDDRVLDIAPATGYSTAVLASFIKDVTAIESDPALQKQAVSNLASLHLHDANIIAAPLTSGWVAKAPYDVILINGCVDAVPDSLLTQLKDGGRLLTVIRHRDLSGFAHAGEARLFEKIRGKIASRSLFDANVKPVPGFEKARGFVF